jgi:transcriptional regulator NrdR family protein
MMSIKKNPKCKTRTGTEESRHHFKYGFATVRRVRRCKKCRYRVVTVELPEEIGDEVFLEEE